MPHVPSFSFENEHTSTLYAKLYSFQETYDYNKWNQVLADRSQETGQC